MKVDKEVASFRLINDSNCCYKDDIQVQFEKIEKSPVQEMIIPKAFQKEIFMNSIVEKESNKKFINISNYKNKSVLFSHVGTSFSVNTTSLKAFEYNGSIDIGYGFFDTAYTKNNMSDGGCFKVYRDIKKDSNLIYENCIDPRSNQDDQKEHDFKLSNLNKNTTKYIFEVTSRAGKNAAWGWSYWDFK